MVQRHSRLISLSRRAAIFSAKRPNKFLFYSAQKEFFTRYPHVRSLYMQLFFAPEGIEPLFRNVMMKKGRKKELTCIFFSDDISLIFISPKPSYIPITSIARIPLYSNLFCQLHSQKNITDLHDFPPFAAHSTENILRGM